MEMIGNQRPGQALGRDFIAKGRQTADEIIPICIVFENWATFNTTTDNVMETAGDIDASLTGHAMKYAGMCQ